jgi:hypothetical protein
MVMSIHREDHDKDSELLDINDKRRTTEEISRESRPSHDGSRGHGPWFTDHGVLYMSKN